MIIAIEGIDGAGKNTLMRTLMNNVHTGSTPGVTSLHSMSFPRYSISIHAQLAQKALHGQMGDTHQSPYAMATLFALDRHHAKATLDNYKSSNEILIIDRYVASNAAYTAARDYGNPDAISWVGELEFDTLELPKPDLQIFLATSPETSAKRAERRAWENPARKLDTYERDAQLQSRVHQTYSEMAHVGWVSDWIIAHEPADVNLEHIIANYKEEIHA